MLKEKEKEKEKENTNVKTESRQITKSMNPKKQGLQILFGDEWPKWNYLHNQLSYVTPCHISSKIAQLAFHYYGKKTKDSPIWDMFGGLGMDAINLAKIFSNVIVSEIDPNVFTALDSNIQNLIIQNPIKAEGTTKNIKALNVDALHLLRDKKFMKLIGLVYFDPPWGNSFKTGEPFDFSEITITTTVNAKSIEQNLIEVLDKLYEKVPNIIVKSPILSDSFEKWAQKKQATVLQICEFPTHKLKYLFLSKQN